MNFSQYATPQEYDSFSEYEKVNRKIKEHEIRKKYIEHELGLERIEDLGLKNKALAELQNFSAESVKNIITENDPKKLVKLKNVLNYFHEERYYTRQKKTLLELAKDGANMPVGLSFPNQWKMHSLYFPLSYPVVIGARPGVGKTTTAIFLMIHFILNNKKCCFYSAEMLAEDIAVRFAAMYYYLTTKKPLTTLEVKSEIRKENKVIVEFLERFNDLIEIVPCQNWPASRIRASHNYLRDKNNRYGGQKIEAVIVDYIQKLGSEKNTIHLGKNEQVGKNINTLTYANQESESSWFILSQLNRDSDKISRKPKLSELRNSGEIEQDAGMVLLLHREEDENGTMGSKINVNVAKNRFGPLKNQDLYMEVKTGAYIEDLNFY